MLYTSNLSEARVGSYNDLIVDYPYMGLIDDRGRMDSVVVKMGAYAVKIMPYNPKNINELKIA